MPPRLPNLSGILYEVLEQALPTVGDWRLGQGNISYVHDLDSDRTFTIGAEFEYGAGSRESGSEMRPRE